MLQMKKSFTPKLRESHNFLPLHLNQFDHVHPLQGRMPPLYHNFSLAKSLSKDLFFPFSNQKSYPYQLASRYPKRFFFSKTKNTPVLDSNLPSKPNSKPIQRLKSKQILNSKSQPDPLSFEILKIAFSKAKILKNPQLENRSSFPNINPTGFESSSDPNPSPNPKYLLDRLKNNSLKSHIGILKLWANYDELVNSGYINFITKEIWSILLASCLSFIYSNSHQNPSPNYDLQSFINTLDTFNSKDRYSGSQTSRSPSIKNGIPLKPRTRVSISYMVDIHTGASKAKFSKNIKAERAKTRALGFLQGMWKAATLQPYNGNQQNLTPLANEDTKMQTYYPSTMTSPVRPTVFEYNVVLECLSQSGSTSIDQVKDIKTSMQNHGILGNTCTFAFYISIAIKVKDWEFFNLTYNEFLLMHSAKIVEITPKIHTLILRAYMAQNHTEEIAAVASEIYSSLIETKTPGFFDNPESWNVLIHAYCKLRNIEKVAFLKNFMTKNKIPTQLHTYAIIFDFLRKMMKSKSDLLRSHLNSHEVYPWTPSPHIKNILDIAKYTIDQYFLMLKEGINPNIIIITNISVTLLVYSSRFSHLFYLPAKLSIAQNRIWNQLLDRDLLSNSHKSVKSLAAYMSDPFTLATALNILQAKKNSNLASKIMHKVFRFSREHGHYSSFNGRYNAHHNSIIVPPVIISAYMGALISCGDYRRAFLEFNRYSNYEYISKNSVYTSIDLFNLAIYALCLMKDYKTALSVVEKMRLLQFGPNLHSLILFFSPAPDKTGPKLNSQRYKMPKQIARSLLSYLQPAFKMSLESSSDTDMLHTQFSILTMRFINLAAFQKNFGISNSAYSLFLQFSKPNIYIYNAALSFFMKTGNLKSMFHFWNEMIAEKVFPNFVSLTILAQAIYKSFRKFLYTSHKFDSEYGTDSFDGSGSGEDYGSYNRNIIMLLNATTSEYTDFREKALEPVGFGELNKIITGIEAQMSDLSNAATSTANDTDPSEQSDKTEILKIDLKSLTLFLKARIFKLTVIDNLDEDQAAFGTFDFTDNTPNTFPSKSQIFDHEFKMTLKLLDSINLFDITPDQYLYFIIREFLVVAGDTEGVKLLEKKIDSLD